VIRPRFRRPIAIAPTANDERCGCQSCCAARAGRAELVAAARARFRRDFARTITGAGLRGVSS
jgi:hypothetical protein